MRDQRYKIEVTSTFMSYEFTSEGPKGSIVKMIKYTETGYQNVYNLGFGDKLKDEDDFDDAVITDNKDSVRILATVAATVFLFTEKYPNAFVAATGSTQSRTRLYRIGISNHLEEIEQNFVVLGYKNNVWKRFVKDQNYSAFLIKRKNDNEKER
jgi:hypothetical protein